MCNIVEIKKEDDLTRVLTYAGFILVSFELVKSLIVKPIKAFYQDTTFDDGIFKSFEEDVLSRHKDIFQASLLYLRDFMKALDSEDVEIIQSLRKHRNELAHDLPNMLSELNVDEQSNLLEQTEKVLFKLSNYRVFMEIGTDPEFKHVDWDSVKGSEYLLFEEVLNKV
ncbi:hypothetical protein J7I09_004417, partial [Vibrio vulnificus]|nr:hypothetical protein [Vibrio vulnificus]